MKIEGGPGHIENVEVHGEVVAGGGGGLGHGRRGGRIGRRTGRGKAGRAGGQREDQDPATATI